jgi:hypothetical protein
LAIKERVEKEVQAYTASSDFCAMVELLKRRERERMMIDVRTTIEREQTEILVAERARLERESSCRIEAHEIVLQNKLKAEEHQRAMYELKLQQDEQRLKEIQERKQMEASACGNIEPGSSGSSITASTGCSGLSTTR